MSTHSFRFANAVQVIVDQQGKATVVDQGDAPAKKSVNHKKEGGG